MLAWPAPLESKGTVTFFRVEFCAASRAASETLTGADFLCGWAPAKLEPGLKRVWGAACAYAGAGRKFRSEAGIPEFWLGC